jgi:N-acylglucosamine 2-epimerase
MLRDFAERYRRELFGSVVPFWMKHSLDREFGGYFTCLDREGAVYDTTKYLWLHGRAAWTFAKLYNEIERRQEWLDAAGSILDFARLNGRDSEGRFYFSLTREGRPAFFQRKPYTGSFVAIGCVEYFKATGDRAYLDEAIEIFWRVKEWIANPMLLGRPVYGGQKPVSQLADWMVLAMVLMELAAVHPDERYRPLMRECFDGALRNLDPLTNVLLESAAPDDPGFWNTPSGRLYCPGSSAELAWFLLHLLRFDPDSGRQSRVLDILEASLEFGWDREYGGLYYFMDIDGRPPLPLESPMKLWWPHTEAIYATILAYTLTREKRWLPWIERLDRYAFEHFSDPEFGEWFGYCDCRGDRTSECKGNNYKGAYHVPRFLLYSVQAIEAHGSVTPSNPNSK